MNDTLQACNGILVEYTVNDNKRLWKISLQERVDHSSVTIKEAVNENICRTQTAQKVFFFDGIWNVNWKIRVWAPILSSLRRKSRAWAPQPGSVDRRQVSVNLLDENHLRKLKYYYWHCFTQRRDACGGLKICWDAEILCNQKAVNSPGLRIIRNRVFRRQSIRIEKTESSAAPIYIYVQKDCRHYGLQHTEWFTCWKILAWEKDLWSKQNR